MDIRRHPSVETEQVLARQLSTGQQAMMAIGSAIGTGLFLGSGLAVSAAGPAVILSFVVGAVLAFLMGAALIEMSVAHPTAGAFGVYAGMYLSPFAGYAVRVSYWLMQVIATGGHMVAISIYMSYWFPEVPGAVWIITFSLALVYLNARAVGTFGEFEYWFVMIKVAAIVIFIGLGCALLLGLTGEPAIGAANYTAHGGFLPNGLWGIWLGACFAFYSYISVEVVGVTSGEAADPDRTIARATWGTLFGLSALYILAMTVLVGIIPWRQAGVGESPFVTVLSRSGIPGAASLMNFVVLTAAVSGGNANLYLMTRMAFSLARAGYVPERLGAVNARGTPLNALLISSLGLWAATLVQARWPDSAYVLFLGVALFGALFVWIMIFATHLAFRRHWSQPGSPPLPITVRFARTASVAGMVLVTAILVSTWWVPGLRPTLLSALPWLAILAIGYRLSRRRAFASAASADRPSAASVRTSE